MIRGANPVRETGDGSGATTPHNPDLRSPLLPNAEYHVTGYPTVYTDGNGHPRPLVPGLDTPVPIGADPRMFDGYKPYGDLDKAGFDQKWQHPDNPEWLNYPDEATQQYAAPGTVQQVELPAGTRLDRFGEEKGGWLAPAGAGYSERAIPPGNVEQPYCRYTTTGAPLPEGWRIEQSVVAPWFDQPGGGLQYRILMPNGETGSVKQLIALGYLA